MVRPAVYAEKEEVTRRRLLSLPLATAAARAQAARLPNIVLILADDLGYGDLSSYGAADLRSTRIDELVGAGVRFDNFYANSPVCSPTRAALLTGRYPDIAGVPGVIRTHARNSWGYLSPRASLLPQPLRTVGYQTGLIGKWHLGLESPNTPTERGFDFFHGFLGDMMDDYYHHRRHGINYMRRGTEAIDPEGHATDLFTDWSIDYLNARKKDGSPFFLYLPYNAPHTPIQPPQDWLDQVKARERGIDEKRARLVALIEHMDHSIGRIVDALKANGQYRDTLLIFTSDNGGQLDVGGQCGPLRGGKQDMYEGGLRVPFCAVWPNRIRAGSRSDRVALTMDLFPTLCEAAGAPVPPGLDGASILPALLGRTQSDGERDLIFVRREGGMRYQGRDYYALRRGEWKLVQNSPFEPFELYNLRSDPKENRDLSSENRAVHQELATALMAHVQRAGRVPWQPPAIG